MGGGLMQLVATGAQDIYLTGKPQITFFKVVFKRYTNFAIEPTEQSFNSAGDFGRTVTCTISRTGDLISNMHVVVSIPAVAASSLQWGYVNRLGHALIAETKVEIGGQLIDEQWGDWLNIWYELSHKTGMEPSFAAMIGDVPALTTINSYAKPAYILYTPLQYWFNRHNGLALPIIALQYHDIKITVQFNTWANVVNYMGPTAPPAQSMVNCFLLTDYIFLDSDERKKFAQSSHEYLIEQLQWYGPETITGQTNKYKLNFNHPCKYNIWAPHLDRYNNRNTWLSHANLTEGNWKLAFTLFAKLMVIAASCPPTGVVPATNPNITSTTIILPVEYVSPAYISSVVQGNIIELNTAATGGITSAMLTKVEVKWIVDTIIYDNNMKPLQIVLVLSNGIVITNTLSIADVSQPISILNSGTVTSVANSIFTSYYVSIIDVFNYGNFLDRTDNPITTGLIQLNGYNRFQPLDGNYFNYVQPFQHFSNTPADGINVFSFALKAEEHQPTGTCNYSRIDNASLEVTLGLYNSDTDPAIYTQYIGNNFSSTLNIYATNYNVLRVISGMAGLAYQN
jgi:hypothetical protein